MKQTKNIKWRQNFALRNKQKEQNKTHLDLWNEETKQNIIFEPYR